MHGTLAVARMIPFVMTLVVALLSVFVPVAPLARAQDVGSVAAVAEVVEMQGLDPSAEEERWWGAAGAILCATEVRLIRVVPAIGLNPYVIAAGLGGCLLAAMDLISSH